MAKLTVYLKNNIVNLYPLEADKTVRIGRDETNDLAIGNPAFAPAHAVVVRRGDECIIKQLNDDFPLILNGKKTQVASLNEGDIITVGEYEIIYNVSSSANSRGQQAKTTTTKTNKTTKTKSNYIAHVANFQVISGTNIGKIFALKIPMTLLGESGSGIVIISKRKDGYFASVLENTDTITINEQPLDNNTVKLNHNDVLVLGNMTVQFYLQ
jgi:predicted component of type VI protein secretion system